MDYVTLTTAAYALGFMHALEPGHGKALMVGTLVGSEERWRDPIRLAVSSAIGHTLGIIFFSTLSLVLVHHATSHDLSFYIESGLGVALFLTGCWSLIKLTTRKRHSRGCPCCNRTSALAPSARGRQLKIVGLLVGLAPCPSALALAATAGATLSIEQLVVVSVIFGAGVASALWAVGVSITHSSERLRNLSAFDTIASYAQYAGPLSLIVVGSLILAHAGSHF